MAGVVSFTDFWVFWAGSHLSLSLLQHGIHKRRAESEVHERKLAHEIAGEVLEVATTWRDYMTDAGVDASDLSLLERCFAMRDLVERWHSTAAQ